MADTNVKLEFLDEKDISKMLTFSDLGNGLELFIDRIDNYVAKCGGAITPTQIRNIYNKIIKVDDNYPVRLQLLRPKLAFVAAKLKQNNQKIIVNLLMSAIKQVKTKEQVKNFKMFMEAFVAYHKYHHGEKDKN